MSSRRISSSHSTPSSQTLVALPPWKRIIDIGFCCAALPLLAVCTFFVTVLMTISSPGPIFFRQERIGYMGRRFRLFKFRTMRVGADTSGHQAHFAELVKSNAPMLKLDAKGDTRLIPCGWLIRAIGLDELPQIINVLKGEMSLVGPRPCIPYEYENYSPQQRLRFRTAPGLTGLWQVSGKNQTTFERMIELDIEYVEKRSAPLDLKILFLTFPALIKQVSEMRRLRRVGIPQPRIVTAHRASARESLEIKKEAVSTVQTS